MSRPRLPDRDPLLSHLCRPVEASGAAHDCPDAGRLGATLDGALHGAERQAVIEHLARCDACRSVAAGLLKQREAPSPRRTWRRFGWPVALAAAAVVTVVVVIQLTRPAPSVSTEALLVAAARELGFEPLDRGERLAGQPLVVRGVLQPLYPRGAILETRPTFRWSPAGAESVHVLVMTADGEPRWRAAAERSPFPYPEARPALEPGGEYLWKVAENGAFAAAAGVVFRVATAAERSAWEAAVAETERRAPARIRDLVRAHLALRRGYLREAERAARAFLRARPEDAVGRETLAHVLRRLGEREAEPR